MTSDGQKLVLVAEDEESEALILQLAFERAKIPNPLVIVRDGQELVDYLTYQGEYSQREAHALPALLILDLKMPRMNGLEVLVWLRDKPEFNQLPAVVLSSSPDQSDIRKAKDAGAREYFVKPHGLRDLMTMVETMRGRWLAPGPA